ncbi:hypothetical protein PENTCL1PPCAC_14768, partial [Pristionchus entomophagus]
SCGRSRLLPLFYSHISFHKTIHAEFPTDFIHFYQETITIRIAIINRLMTRIEGEIRHQPQTILHYICLSC